MNINIFFHSIKSS